MKTVPELLEITKNMINSVDFCFLITLGESGQPNARLVQHFKTDESLVVWFGTSPKSRKANELRQNPHLSVAFYHPDDTAYVTLKGAAELVDDLNLRREKWYENWIAFFPEGPEGNDYVLLKFVPSVIEMVNFAKRVTPPPFGLMHADLVRVGDEWQLK